MVIPHTENTNNTAGGIRGITLKMTNLTELDGTLDDPDLEGTLNDADADEEALTTCKKNIHRDDVSQI